MYLGKYCPGCGGTRALVCLLNFDILNSLRYNPFPLCLIIDLLYVIITKIIERQAGYQKHYWKSQMYLRIAILIIIGLYSIIRNVLLISFRIDLVGDFIS